MKYLSAPVEVGLEITSACNMNCTHCYASQEQHISDKELEYSEITKLIDELADMKVFKFSVVGGEPFMRKDATEIIRYAKNKGLSTVCSTNGWYLDDHTLDKLKSYEIDNIQISIDGSKPETHDKIRGLKGSFERAMDSAKRARKIDLPVSIGTTVMSYNWKEIPEIANISAGLGANCLHIMCMQPGGRGINGFYDKLPPDNAWVYITNFLQEVRPKLEGKISIRVEGSRFACINQGLIKPPDVSGLSDFDKLFINCDCAKTRCVVDSYGNVLPCDMVRISDRNIRFSSFSEAWQTSETLKNYRERHVSQIDECSECEFTESCGGGCTSSALNIYGTYFAADPRCKIAKRPDDEKNEIQT